MGKAKIVYTVGPDTDKTGAIEQLIMGGMDVARCSFSYGGLEECSKRMHTVRSFHTKWNLPIAILMDIKEMEGRMELQKEDILFGIQQKVDFVSTPFLYSGQDVLDIRRLLNENGGSNITLIAKIENGKGIENLDSILKAADGIMIGKEVVPMLQKMIMKKIYESGKMLITETQMLDFHVDSVKNV